MTYKTYDWKSINDKYYYYNIETGKIVATACKIALHEVFNSIAYTGKVTYRIDDERHLGQYISLEHAKRAAELYWDIENRTLIAE